MTHLLVLLPTIGDVATFCMLLCTVQSKAATHENANPEQPAVFHPKQDPCTLHTPHSKSRVENCSRAKRCVMWIVFWLMAAVAVVATTGSIESIVASASRFSILSS